MPYAPTVNNISGQIYGQGITGAAEAEASGIVGAAKIASEKQAEADKMWAAGISSLGSSIGGAVSTYAGTKMQADYLQGKFDTYQQRGLIDDATAKKFTEGNLGTRMGIITTQDALFEASLKNAQAQQNYNRQVALEDYRMGQTDVRLSQPGTTYNTATGQPVGTIRTSPSSVQVLPQPTVPKTAAPIATDQGLVVPVPGKPGVFDYARDTQGNILKPQPKSNYLLDMLGPDEPGLPATPTTGTPTTAAPSAAPGIPPGSKVDFAGASKKLRSDPTPENKAAFDEFFGPGAAAAVLGE